MLYKHPRTKHAPWSKTVSSDDKIMFDYSVFEGKRVIITEKMDGENTTGYPNFISHARSMDSKNHPSRNWFKTWWAKRCFKLPEGWRVCGENVYATHSIAYTELTSYFYGFSVYNSDNILLDWDSTLKVFSSLKITPVPVLYDGIFTNEVAFNLRNGWLSNTDNPQFEGYVIRLADSIAYDDYTNSVMKYVRANHVQETDEHWMQKPVVKNGMK
jgi:hypothetical protein